MEKNMYVLDVDQKDAERAGQIFMKLDERGTIAYDDCEKYNCGGRDIASFYIRVRPNMSIEEVKGELEAVGITLL